MILLETKYLYEWAWDFANGGSFDGTSYEPEEEVGTVDAGLLRVNEYYEVHHNPTACFPLPEGMKIP